MSVETVERARGAQIERFLAALAVVAQHAVERLQAYVASVQVVEHTRAVDVMVEIASRVGVIEVVQDMLACMSEGRVPQIVAKGNSFREVFVEAQHACDGARGAGDELYVQAPSRDVVVAHETEHLGFARVPVIGRNVEDFVDVSAEWGAVQPLRHVSLGVASYNVFVFAAIGAGNAFFDVGIPLVDELGREIVVSHGCSLAAFRKSICRVYDIGARRPQRGERSSECAISCIHRRVLSIGRSPLSTFYASLKPF